MADEYYKIHFDFSSDGGPQLNFPDFGDQLDNLNNTINQINSGVTTGRAGNAFGLAGGIMPRGRGGSIGVNLRRNINRSLSPFKSNIKSQVRRQTGEYANALRNQTAAQMSQSLGFSRSGSIFSRTRSLEGSTRRRAGADLWNSRNAYSVPVIRSQTTSAPSAPRKPFGSGGRSPATPTSSPFTPRTQTLEETAAAVQRARLLRDRAVDEGNIIQPPGFSGFDFASLLVPSRIKDVQRFVDSLVVQGIVQRRVGLGPIVDETNTLRDASSSFMQSINESNKTLNYMIKATEQRMKQ